MLTLIEQKNYHFLAVTENLRIYLIFVVHMDVIIDYNKNFEDLRW